VGACGRAGRPHPNADRDGDAVTDRDARSDHDRDPHGNFDAYADADSYTHPFGHSDSHGDGNGDGNGDIDAYAPPHSCATAAKSDPAARNPYADSRRTVGNTLRAATACAAAARATHRRTYGACSTSYHWADSLNGQSRYGIDMRS
jgi:hypothetical protein